MFCSNIFWSEKHVFSVFGGFPVRNLIFDHPLTKKLKNLPFFHSENKFEWNLGSDPPRENPKTVQFFFACGICRGLHRRSGAASVGKTLIGFFRHFGTSTQATRLTQFDSRKCTSQQKEGHLKRKLWKFSPRENFHFENFHGHENFQNENFHALKIFILKIFRATKIFTKIFMKIFTRWFIVQLWRSI